MADTPYVVSPGDTLWGIAEDLYGDPLRWPDLATENDLLPPYCIFPEQALSLPATTRK